MGSNPSKEEIMHNLRNIAKEWLAGIYGGFISNNIYKISKDMELLHYSQGLNIFTDTIYFMLLLYEVIYKVPSL